MKSPITAGFLFILALTLPQPASAQHQIYDSFTDPSLNVMVTPTDLQKPCSVVPTGTEKQYYATGEIYMEAACVAGKQHGLTRIFRKSGEVFSTARYKNGELHGTVTIFREDGTTIAEKDFENGRRVKTPAAVQKAAQTQQSVDTFDEWKQSLDEDAPARVKTIPRRFQGKVTNR